MKRYNFQSDQRGMTLIELVVSFALLSLFMVSATFIISYTIQLYHNSKGAIYGMEVANMIANKVVGQIETATAAKTPVVLKATDGSEFDSLTFSDGTGSIVTISASVQSVPQGAAIVDDNAYVCIRYDAVTEGSVKYEPVDWRFDRRAYMGYGVAALRFENPNGAGEKQYPDNVLRMVLTLSSDKYGMYTKTYYIKLVHVTEIQYR